jgi:UDP-3-O-[3-hydroxymyristoyl] glucosamine N-acyltransferase
MMTTVADVIRFLEQEGLATAPTLDAGTLRVELRGVAADSAAVPGELSWISPKRFRQGPPDLRAFRGSLLLVPSEGMPAPSESLPVVGCHAPKLAFTRVVDRYFKHLLEVEWPASGPSSVAADAVIGRNVRLAPGVVIGPNTALADGVSVGPNTCIANSSVSAGVRIGANCTIGLPGFGYERDESGQYSRFPHVGRVRIEEDVEIGSNTCIDRGALGDTVIGRGCKIDNLVHIAHNVVLGANVLVIANAMVAGSVTVGDGAWIAPSASVLNQLTIGEGATVGLGAVVIRPVDPGATVAGNPARPLERRVRS